MIHYYVELTLWMVFFYFAGCPLGVLARRLRDRRRRQTSA